ncbi:MAG: DNA mismatch repair protein MutS [Firmicutes bacterium]|nr:DNA mismatch repair protein MutS [Bacillota bacterium]
MKVSPMMQQYMEIKKEYQDCILFFRLGDFYEMFFEDARIASRELELTLTGKNCGQEERAPMCGVPFHSAESYIARLVERGYKVAICEQMEDPKTAKGIVKREVIQIVTPGTLTAQSMLAEKENNYLASVHMDEDGMAVAYCDVSTGELNVTEYHGKELYETLLNELVKIKAREIIVCQSFCDRYDLEELRQITEAYIDVRSSEYYSVRACEEAIKAQFQTISLTGLGLDFRPYAVVALGVLLNYLLETQKQSLKHLTRVNIYEIGGHMTLDKATLRNLEITETLYERKIAGSLLGVLDKTHTAMGSRKMKQWLREPLNDATEINLRLDAVESLFHNPLLRNNLKEALKEIYDFERLTGRIACGSANGKDLIALRNSIAVLPEVKEILSDLSKDSRLMGNLNDEIHPLSEVFQLIDASIVEEPPFLIREGGLIRPGFSDELDQLKDSIKDGKHWIANLENSERERTGIRNLKVGYNRVFGYYLEVTKSFYDMVPDNYIRKQTLANAERYITPELKEMESLVLNAETKINQMEYDLFCNVRDQIQNWILPIQKTSSAIASLDVLCAFAEVSEKLGYVKPVIDESMEISICRGRHPVIEQTIPDGQFVSNDVYLNDNDASMLLITGPNMAGKSTYMRQTALIVLMAQAGCFVPCESARIGVVDRIFTRIGASDNLAQGQSTFFVEMSELSYILSSARARSLVILDEIGRGTSTYDGLSIAWAAVEYLCNEKTHIRTLFATHYHELTVLQDEIHGVKNLNVDVSEEHGNIIFLHRIVEGSASRSYGIHVAKLAGIPKKLLARAEEKLKELEEGAAFRQEEDALPDSGPEKQARTMPAGSGISVHETKDSRHGVEGQISLYDFAPVSVVERLRDINLMEITPSQAFQILEELKESLDD